MSSPELLLLDLWPEACRPVRIDRSIGTMARRLATDVTFDTLLLLDLEFHKDATEGTAGGRTLASVTAEGSRSRHLTRARTLTRNEARHVRTWIRQNALVSQRIEATASLPLVLDALTRVMPDPPDSGTWIAGSLSTEDGVQGALLLHSVRSSLLDPDSLELVEAALEPFAVALGEDHRLRERERLARALGPEAPLDPPSGTSDTIETIVGGDGGLRPVMKRVELVADSDVPVLILGETGSGKEVIARAIHDQSPRRDEPFIRVNCGAISPELIDSELFGHEKGAFTGAVSTHRGWFERADQGTLLLDEVGELPLPAQVRLLRVLQEGVFERVGGERPIRADVRIVAATHRDLPTLVRKGHFREDLWYRITGFPILLPPLRERKEDLPDLVGHFVDRAARRFGLRPLTISAEDMGLLTRYDWPGNIRELASVIDRAAILGAGESLEIRKALGGVLDTSPTEPAEPPSSPLAGAAPSSPTSMPSGPLESLDDAMRRHIETALASTRGQIEGTGGAAEVLDINPHTLRARMRKLGIDWTRYRAS